MVLAAGWKSKPSDNAQKKLDEKAGKEPGDPTPAVPEPPDPFQIPTDGPGLDQPGHGLAGRWTRRTDGLTEVWTVRCPAGKWEVSGQYFDGANEAGSFVGSDVKLSGQTLSFTQKFDRQPPRPWLSGAKVSANLDGGKIAFAWRFGGSSGTGTLVRMADME